MYVLKLDILLTGLVESQVSTLNPKVQDVVNSEKTAILGGDPLQDFNKKFFEAHKSVARR